MNKLTNISFNAKATAIKDNVKELYGDVKLYLQEIFDTSKLLCKWSV